MATNKVSASQKYWEKRRALEDQYRLIQEQATLKKLTDDILPGALKEIQKQLMAQADLHNITMSELLADYSTRDQKKYREYVEKNYKALMDSDEKYQEFIDEYFPDYDYAKVNRLLQIRTDIFDIFAREMIKKDENKVFNDRLEDILQRTYSSNSQALARILSVDIPNKLSQSELDNILNYPWSGKTFSNRLWGNVSRLEQNLSASIVKSISSGQGVVEALRTMKQDPEICDMFKLESSKFRKAIDNLVRTEYASFAQQGIAKSYEATGVNEYDVLTSEDEKVCTICGGAEKGNPYKLKDAVIGVNRGPFHGRCRCTDIPHIPDLPSSIDKEYEAMFGDLLDEFANDQFGVKLTHPKTNQKSAAEKHQVSLKSVFDKTNMKQMVGNKNYNNFLKSLDSIDNENLKKLMGHFGSQLEFDKLSDTKNYARGRRVHLNQTAFDGSDTRKAMQTVFHELGHAIDSLGAETIDSIFDQISKDPSYKLKNDIKKDMLNLFNEELKAVNGANHKTVKNLKKMSIFDQSAIVRKYKKLADEFPLMYSSLSDMMESTGGFIDRPLGSGHGLKYWKTSGNQESEFFAHMTEAAVNEESRKMMYELFPLASKKWEKMLEDILKGTR